MLPLIVHRPHMHAALPADRVEFVDEYDAWGLRSGLLEQVTNAGGSYTYKHFHKIASAQRKEWNPRFSGDGFCQQCLARSGGADQQHSFGNFSPKGLVPFGVLQEIHYLLQFIFSFVATGHIGKTHARIAVGDQFGATLSKT